MNFYSTGKIKILPFLPILIGITSFFLITSGEILIPTNTDWLMEGDPAQHWIGWQFFRDTPFFQWPLGANPNYGMSIGSSIIFSDSIPLLAFLFKPFNSILPEKFQYFGLWILICFILQSFFAWKLLSRFTKDKMFPVIGSISFILAPVYLYRLQFHYALFSHWVLLAAFYLYFSKKYSNFLWLSLLFATALIHAYLLLMIIVIWFSDLTQRYLLKQTEIKNLLSYMFFDAVIISFIMWAVGYFMLGTEVQTNDFTTVRMNLLSLIDPEDTWSLVLPNLGGDKTGLDGLNYLGLGMIVLGLVAVSRFFPHIKISLSKRIIPLFVLCIGLFLYAISNNVSIGTHVLFSYDLPSIVKPLWSTFRYSGRFFWPVYYLLYLSIFYLIFTKFSRRDTLILILCMLFIQIIDYEKTFFKLGWRFYHITKWISPMRSVAWDDIAKCYNKIIVILPSNDSPNWVALSEFASSNQMAINIGSFARISNVKLQKEKEYLTTSIKSNELDPQSLYIFQNDELWNIASMHTSYSDFAGVIDGFRIVAPKLMTCTNVMMLKPSNTSS